MLCLLIIREMWGFRLYGFIIYFFGKIIFLPSFRRNIGIMLFNIIKFYEREIDKGWLEERGGMGVYKNIYYFSFLIFLMNFITFRFILIIIFFFIIIL